MRSNQSSNKRKAWRYTALIQVLTLALVGTMGVSGVASAEDTAGEKWTDGFWEAFTEGKPTLNMRGRIEIAQAGPLNMSDAYTLRTRLGYGTKAWHGMSIFGEMLNVTSPATERYWDGNTDNTSAKTIIADPVVTEMNQAWFKFENEDWLGSKFIGGRQRIILDDSRFIGNVGWRQNEQTYDSVLGSTSLGVDKLAITYSWIGNVSRIFGNQDTKTDPTKPPTMDFGSNSHIINGGYKGWKFLKPAAFVYLLDLRSPTAPGVGNGLSSASYGLRATGVFDIGEKLKLGYGASYAVQTDFGNNPTDYVAHYLKLDASLGGIPLFIGKLAAGWEMLGSDNGNARFVTPLATLHKFNGWADVFLTNGGGNGLRDLYFEWAPALPWELKTRMLYHYFTADNGGAKLGDEFDAVIKRKFGNYFELLAKGAYFKPEQGATVGTTPLVDIWRVWMDATIKF
jgi:hypothetical protein